MDEKNSAKTRTGDQNVFRKSIFNLLACTQRSYSCFDQSLLSVKINYDANELAGISHLRYGVSLKNMNFYKRSRLCSSSKVLG